MFLNDLEAYVRIDSDEVVNFVKDNKEFFMRELGVEDQNGKLLSLERKTRRNNNLIAGAVTSVVAGGLGAGITASVLQAKYETAANEAVAAWMEEIGEHIQCYLGTEELGTYGDVVSFTIE